MSDFSDWLNAVNNPPPPQAQAATRTAPDSSRAYRTGNILNRLRRLETGEIRLRRNTVQSTNGQFSRGNIGSLEAGDTQGRFNIRSSYILKRGSVPPQVSDGFGITYTDTTAHIYWDGTNGSTQITIRRADNTYLVVPPNSLAITGLTASTKYSMLPFWSTDIEGDGCGAVGWVPGDSGSPLFCMANVTADQLHQQQLEGREPLAHPWITFTTGVGGAGAAQTTSGGGSVYSGSSYVDSTGIVHPSLL